MDAITSQNQAISVAQNHLSGGSNVQVADLTFNSPLLVNVVPTNIFGIFQNIKTFFANNVQLHSLGTNAIVNCLKLETITFTSNAIANIDASFAETCINLINIQFDGNQIQTIHKDAFKGLSKVEQIHLMSNNITTLDPAVFAATTSVKRLYLNFNQITTVSARLSRNSKNYVLTRSDLSSASKVKQHSLHAADGWVTVHLMHC